MDDRPSSSRYRSSVELELYFLIERYLSAGPCKSAAKVLRRELDEHGLLPKRIDWEGKEHKRSFESLLELNRHVGGYHLLKICQRLGPLLDKQLQPRITGVASLLGAGSQSLLRTEADMEKLQWLPEAHTALLHGKTPLPPVNLVQPNWFFVNRGREMTGQARQDHLLPTSMHDKIKRHSRRLGHLSSIYCVLFDRTGRYIITGADDQLVKIWIAADGRLKATLRGHSAEISDMDINYENTLLASGSCDKTIRVWCMKTTAPLAVLQGHTGMVTSIQFSPFVRKGDARRYLASTGGDGCVCFWEWNASTSKFNPKPIKYIERSRAGAMILCSSFSPGGMFFAAGSTDHVIRMYHFHAGVPEKIGELEKHIDRVDSICYAHHDNRFLSGSRDGTARIWRFERNEWRNIALEMKVKLKKGKSHWTEDVGDEDETTYDAFGEESSAQQKLKVTMVGWNLDDLLVITAVNDLSLKVWCSFTGTLKFVLKGHQDEVFVLEPNPIDPNILLSAGHDGNIIIWDIQKGTKVKTFFNSIEGQGHGGVFDCKFSLSGTSLAATDSHGHMMIYGFGSYQNTKKIPDELFFHTDYRPLIRDSNNYVLDEQTQQAPHLMPPPFLVDIDGNPYPPHLQRLVPGRENCREDLLVPQLAVNEDGAHEVVGEQDVPEADLPPEEPQAGEVPVAMRPSIDQMIEDLQRQQDRRMIASGAAPLNSPPPAAPPMGSPRAVNRSNSVAAGGPVPGNSPHMVGMRRVGETEGVRQSLGNIQQVSSKTDLAALTRNTIVTPLPIVLLRKSEVERQELADQELRQFNVERKKKNPVVRRDSGDEPCHSGVQTRKKNVKKRGGYSTSQAAAGGGGAENEETATNRLTTRALYDTDEEAEASMELEEWNDDEYKDGDNGDSSEYSDWCVDTSSNLQPPKRTSTRKRKPKRYLSSEEEEDDDDNSDDEDRDLVDDGETQGDDDDYQESQGSSQSRGKRPRRKDKQPAGKKQKKKRRESIDKAHLNECSPEAVQKILTIWRAPDWLTDVVPHKQPYFPQMGDELVYFRQGHELYVKAVEKRKTYPIDPNKNQAWHKYPSLREQELVRIVGVRYELLKNGVRLCCLKLTFIDPVSLKISGGSFSIKYHDMPDVVDFLVLKQNYDIAMARNWKPGDRFMSVIDDSWWFGIIESHNPYQEEYPDSMFQCFKVRWDNAEREHLSPWDLEPVIERRNPSVLGGGVQVTEAELKALLYKPKLSEWMGHIRGEECNRILVGIEKVMQHSIAEPFLTPVDLNAFPSYAMSIEYPMDLNTIKRRLEHRFYRRVTALQFDIRYIEINAKKFNEPKSQIVRKAQVLCDALLNSISDRDCEDPCAIINMLSRGRKLQLADVTDSGDETEEYDSPTNKQHKKRESSPGMSHPSKRRRLAVGQLDPEGWKLECRQLLNTILQCEDSTPFREPVDRVDYPVYYNVIQNPIALSEIRDKFDRNVYTSPAEMTRDMKLMFNNSRIYNTNKRSKIYSMTLRLSAMYESRMKSIIGTWKKALHVQRKKYSDYSVPRSHSEYSEQPGSSRLSVRPFASVSRASALTNGRTISSDNDTDVDVTSLKGHRSKRQRLRERRQRARYADSDPEAHGFPDPKPDYSDDDFELPSTRNSPKKKGRHHSSVMSNGNNNASSSGTRYSTRAATGSIKARKYTNAGYFTDEDEEEIPTSTVLVENHHSDSDTELEDEPSGKLVIATSRGTRHRSKHRQTRVSTPPARSSKRKHSDVETDSGSGDSESKTDNTSSESSSSSSTENNKSEDSGSDTEPSRPVEHVSQGYHSGEHATSSHVRRKQSKTSSYASSATSSRRPVRTSNRGKQPVTYHEDSDNSDSGENSMRSVSSRGRVRKPTARARGIFD